MAVCEASGVEAASDAVKELVDAMHYATKSLPGAGRWTRSPRAKAIELALMDLDEAPDADAVAAGVATICREVKLAKLAIKRREDLMKTLR